MQKVRTYFRESYQELMTKVTWPTWGELQSSAIIVLVASLIIGLVVFGMDAIFQGLVNLLYQMF